MSGHMQAAFATIKGWQLLLHDLPMFLLFVYAVVFLVMTIVVSRGIHLSARWLCIPAGLGAGQGGLLLAIEAYRDLSVQVAAIAGTIAFSGMLYLATAKVK
jgi:hypothetical protein